MKLRFVVLLFVVMIQCGCGTMKPIPGDTFYRLKHHDAPASEAGSTPWTQTPLIIERFRASGIYKDRAIVLLQADGVSLTQSDYHYWNNSPEVMLQERFSEHAAVNRLAGTIVLNKAVGAEYIVTGRIIRFERVKTDDAANRVSIKLELGVQRATNGREILFQKQFAFTEAVAGEQMSAVVTVFSTGIDQLFSQFISEAGNAINQPPR